MLNDDHISCQRFIWHGQSSSFIPIVTFLSKNYCRCYVSWHVLRSKGTSLKSRNHDDRDVHSWSYRTEGTWRQMQNSLQQETRLQDCEKETRNWRKIRKREDHWLPVLWLICFFLFPPPHFAHPLSFSLFLPDSFSFPLAPSSFFSLSVEIFDVLFLLLAFSTSASYAFSLSPSQKCRLRKAQTRKVLFSCYVDKNASRSCQNYVTTIFECCLTPTNGILGSREKSCPH